MNKKVKILIMLTVLFTGAKAQFFVGKGAYIGSSRIYTDWTYGSQWVHSFNFSFDTSEDTQVTTGLLFSQRWSNSLIMEGLSIGTDWEPFNQQRRIRFVLSEQTHLLHIKYNPDNTKPLNSVGVTQIFTFGFKPYIDDYLYFQIDAGFNLSMLYPYESILYFGFGGGTVLDFRMGFSL